MGVCKILVPKNQNIILNVVLLRITTILLRKNFNWSWITVKMYSPLFSWWEASQHTGRHGVGVVTESSASGLANTLGLSSTLETLKLTSSDTISSTRPYLLTRLYILNSAIPYKSMGATFIQSSTDVVRVTGAFSLLPRKLTHFLWKVLCLGYWAKMLWTSLIPLWLIYRGSYPTSVDFSIGVQ